MVQAVLEPPETTPVPDVATRGATEAEAAVPADQVDPLGSGGSGLVPVDGDNAMAVAQPT
jgi:hypothetical protein